MSYSLNDSKDPVNTEKRCLKFFNVIFGLKKYESLGGGGRGGACPKSTNRLSHFSCCMGVLNSAAHAQ